MNLPEISVKRPVAMSMVALIMMVLGVVAFERLGLDFFPDLQFPEVNVITTYPGASSAEIETLITKPLEEAVATVAGVRKVKSSSREGSSLIQAELEWGSNMDLIAQDVRNMIDIAYDLLPDDVDRPMVLKGNVDMIPILYYGVYSKTGRDLRNLRKLIEDQVEKRLDSLSGVASASVTGGLDREILVDIDKNRLKAHGLSLNDISRVIRSQNRDIPGGHLVQGTREFVVRTLGQYKNASAIADTVITVSDGRPVYIKDVADVKDLYKEKRDRSKANGVDSVIFWVTKESGANTVEVVDVVRKELAKIEKTLPPDVVIVNAWDMSKLVRDSVAQLKKTVLWGSLLTVIVLYIFLRNIRTTLTLFISIPFAVITTFVAIYFGGYTLNLITLSGLALGVGMIVDNSVVVLENIFRHLEMGEDRKTAAKNGATEVSMAITASTLTSVIVFVPLIFAQGLAGEFTKPLGLTVAFALLASLFVALTIVPMLASKVLVLGKPKGQNFFKKMVDRYRRVIGFSLNNRKLMVVLAFVILILSIAAMGMIKGEYLSRIDEPYATGVIKLAPGTSLDETLKYVDKFEELLMKQPEFKSIISLTGLSDLSKVDLSNAAGPAGVNESEIFLELCPPSERSRTSAEFLRDMLKELPKLVDGTCYFMQTMDYFTMGGDRPIEIKIFGSDLDVLKRLSDSTEVFLKSLTGVIEVDKSLRMGKPELKIEVDREKASLMGITAGMVAETVDAAFLGRKVSKYREGGDEFDIRVRFAKEDRATFRDLESITIQSPMGFQVNLSSLAVIQEGYGPIEIKREDRERFATIRGNYSPDEADLGAIREKIEAYFENNPLPEGCFYKFGGSIEDMSEMKNAMIFIMVLIILLVYMVMAAQFESFAHPLAIMVSVPLAFIGAALALLLTGNSLSVMSSIGIMMLIGIVVNNGIVLIDYVNQLRAKGMEKHAAIKQAGVDRLRPILMTTLTTSLALTPMAISTGDGAALFAPLAITIFGGLLTSTFLTLVIVPSVYSLIDGASERINNFARGLRD